MDVQGWLKGWGQGRERLFRLSAIAGAVTLFVLLIWKLDWIPRWPVSALLVLWTVVPPIWFLYEWSQWTPPTAETFDQEFKRFKYSQDLAKILWAGIALLLGFWVGIRQ
jgi:hypothetical protein